MTAVWLHTQWKVCNRSDVPNYFKENRGNIMGTQFSIHKPKNNYVPEVGEKFMISWISLKDRSYTDRIWEVLAKNDVAVLAEPLLFSRVKEGVLFRFEDVRFHTVTKEMVDYFVQRKEEDRKRTEEYDIFQKK